MGSALLLVLAALVLLRPWESGLWRDEPPASATAYVTRAIDGDTIEVRLDGREEDVRYQTLRASGPGGQHVNKTDSAVRATHGPTGLATLSQDQRSQFANKKIARLKLAMLLEERRREGAAGGKRALWGQNRELERGNAVRSYEGVKFMPSDPR